MNQSLRWRLVLVAVVVALSVWAIYPPSEKISLGLDLKGGVHLVLGVHTDDALRRETETTVERLRETLTEDRIAFTSIDITGLGEFVVEGVQDDQGFRNAAIDAEAVFERSSVGGRYTFRMRPNIANQLRSEAVSQALQTIERRVNELGVAEPVVALYTEQDQILVQLPGVTDVERAKSIISSTALLELKLVERAGFSSEESARQAYAGNVPADLEVVPGVGSEYYVLRATPIVAGRDLRSAQPSRDEFNRPAVAFSLTQDAARRFGPFTEQNLGKQLAIVLDGRVISAPVLEGRITDNGQITGNFTAQETQDLSLQLRSGALPASMEYLEQRTVGPSLGADSIRAGIVASLGGLFLVVVFMLGYYRLAGINAILAQVVNLLMLLAAMASLGAVMTLPGIAGFILTIGMSTDSNVLIFERIKEELNAGKGVRAAVQAGFDRVLLTIIDTHLTSLIAAAFLFQFGTGPIRGFATTLTFGLIANVFTAVFVSRALFEVVLSRRRGQPQPLSI